MSKESSSVGSAHYRLYHVQGGRFAWFEEFAAENDEVAVELASAWIEAEPAELWCQARLVRTFNGGRES